MSPDPQKHNGHGSNGGRPCCEAHVESSRCNWLNVSDCEYCALTHGAAHGLGVRAYMADLEFELSLQIFSDSSAAKAFAVRRGLGRQRHVQTRHLWLQERVAATHLTVQKVGTTQNPADILTKAVSRERLERHRKKIGLRHVEAHSSQKELRHWSKAANPVPEMCTICGKPADASRTSTGEFRRLWYCRGCWRNWNSQDDGNANVNSVVEEFISVECTSHLRCRARQWTSTCTLLESTRWDRLRDS